MSEESEDEFVLSVDIAHPHYKHGAITQEAIEESTGSHGCTVSPRATTSFATSSRR